MSLDRSLKTMQGLMRHRNVLNRAERIKKLSDEERWDESRSLFGLPKVANRNLKVGKKTAKKEEAPGAEAGAEGGAEAKAKEVKDVKKEEPKPRK